MVLLHHDTLPATATAPVELVLVSQAANVPSSPLTLMLSSSVPPRSLTTRLVSPGNEVCQLFCLNSFVTTWPHFLHFLIF